MNARQIKYKTIDTLTLLGSGTIGFARGYGMPMEPIYDIGAFIVPPFFRGIVTSSQKKGSLSANIDSDSLTVQKRESLDNFVNKAAPFISGVGGFSIATAGYLIGLASGYMIR